MTQTRLLVSDLPAAFRYYRDVIGLRPMYDPPQSHYAAFVPGLGSAVALHDRAALAALLGPELRTDGDRGRDHALIVLRVDDLAAYTAEVTERGGHVLAGPVAHGDRVRAAYLRDPDGNLIEIQQWLATRDGGPVPPAS